MVRKAKESDPEAEMKSICSGKIIKAAFRVLF
jgi:hypothetical protein